MAESIAEILAERGPLTGSELLEAARADGFSIWREARKTPGIILSSVARRYLRLDRRLKDLSRISPSIFREFLTYTVVGLEEQREAIERRCDALSAHIEKVSKEKIELAYGLMCAIGSSADTVFPLDKAVCVIIAGDIVYCMAHDVPRPERSTGRLVRGSDIDLVVVADENIPEHVLKRVDDLIYKEKYRLLITPHIREEIDYVVKGIDRVREQLLFDNFSHILACKILQEGTLLYGNGFLFSRIKTMLRDSGVTGRLLEMENSARIFRREAEERLMQLPAEDLSEEDRNLFYPADESEEFD
jgi:hypothetical protein